MIPPGPLSCAAHLSQGLQVVFPEVHTLMKTQVSLLVLQFGFLRFALLLPFKQVLGLLLLAQGCPKLS